MLEIPIEIVIVTFGLIGTLIFLIWNTNGRRISRIEAVQSTRQCNAICGHIEAIQRDIEWIKKSLDNIK